MKRIATASLRASFVSSPAALLALLLALLLWFSTHSISGFGRGGEDDEGSGIGGTGLLPVPGSESGLGGTGFRPFVGMTPAGSAPEAAAASREIIPPGAAAISVALEHPSLGPAAIRFTADSAAQTDTDTGRPLEVITLLDSYETILQSQPVLDAPLPRPVEVIAQRDLTFDSGPVLITEQIQRDIDSNAKQLLSAADTATVAQTASKAHPVSPSGTPESYSHAVAEGQELVNPPVPNLAETTEANSATDLASKVDSEPSWYELAALISDYQASDQASDGTPRIDSTSRQERVVEAIDATTGDSDRVGLPGKRPGRLRRPELPAVQSARPPQRVTILPPRIRPLGL
jgi:hypothetical protein